MLLISNSYREISGIKTENEIDVNHNLSDRRIQRGEKNVQLLIDFIHSHEKSVPDTIPTDGAALKKL